MMRSRVGPLDIQSWTSEDARMSRKLYCRNKKVAVDISMNMCYFTTFSLIELPSTSSVISVNTRWLAIARERTGEGGGGGMMSGGQDGGRLPGR